MNNKDIYDYVLAQLDKDDRGNVISPDEFTDYLQRASRKYFNDKYRMFEETQNVSDVFNRLTVQTSLTFDRTAQSVQTPSNYAHHIGAYLGIDAANYIDIVTKTELVQRLSNSITKPTGDNPVIALFDSSENLSTRNLTYYPSLDSEIDVILIYIKTPDDPFFDYFILSNGTIEYVQPGVTEVTIPSGAVHSSGATSGTIDSRSVELEYDDIFKEEIVDYILQMAGINNENQLAIGYADKEETKASQK